MRKNIINSSHIIDLSALGDVSFTPPAINNHIVVFDGTEGQIKGSGSTIADLGDVKTNGSVIDENIVVYDGTSGDSIKDSGINKSILVGLPTFSWHSGNTIMMVPFASGSNVTVGFSAFKVSGSNNLVTLTIDRYIGNMSSIQYFISSSTLSVGFRPAVNQLIPIFTYTNSNEVDSDIIGAALVNTGGSIQIYKEYPPGTGLFNGSNVGWGSISLSYRTA